MVTVIYRVVAAAVLIGLAIWVCVGWRDWLGNRSKTASLAAVCAFLGFTFASISLLLELGTGAYTHFGFRAATDPSIVNRFYVSGFATALVGFACSFIGSDRKNPLRWKARAVSAVLLVLWAGQIVGTIQSM